MVRDGGTSGQKTGGCDEHCTRADAGHQRTGLVKTRNGLGYLAALNLRSCALGRAIDPIPARHNQNIQFFFERKACIRPNSQPVCSGDLLGAINSHHLNLDVRAGRGGVFQDLVRRNGVKLIESIEDNNLRFHTVTRE